MNNLEYGGITLVLNVKGILISFQDDRSDFS
jgi:hypothetical protein